jgi:hypothetical protein
MSQRVPAGIEEFGVGFAVRTIGSWPEASAWAIEARRHSKGRKAFMG